MDEDEAALLAELRAISNKSAASRFDSNDNDDHNDNHLDNLNDNQHHHQGDHTSTRSSDNASFAIHPPEKRSPNEPETRGGNSEFSFNHADTKESATNEDDQQYRNDDTEDYHQEEYDNDNDNPLEHDLDDDFMLDELLADESPVKSKSMERSLEESTDDAHIDPTSSEILPDNSKAMVQNGGAAEDAELLAMLKRVSARSSAADRFQDEDIPNKNIDNTTSENKEEEGVATNVGTSSSSTLPTRASDSAQDNDHDSMEKPQKRISPRNSKQIPPWKRDQAFAKKQAARVSPRNSDILVLEPLDTKSSLEDGQTQQETMTVDPSEPLKNSPDNTLARGSGNFKKESTFQGERGGAAEDEELLALLRGVSAKSSAVDRFAEDENGESDFVPAPVAAPKPKAPAPANRSQRTGGDVPPWKRGKAAAPASNQSTTDDVVVVASKAQPTPREPLSQEVVLGGGGNFKKESTFQGERGGSAEDEELLALLRGVSAKSGAADRFADDENGESDFVPAPVAAPKPKAPAPTNRSQRTGGDVPPWKRGKAATPASNQSTTDDVVVVASKAQPTPREPLSQEAVLGGGGNFKKESTFQGERGGSAEDEELLALLRGVSAKSGAADRFADDENGESDFVPAPVAAPKPKAPAPTNRSHRTGGDVPPWKRGKAATPASNQSTTDDVVVVASKAQPTPREPLSQEAVLGGGGNFKKESTFQGERGGSAEDEELLALLRGVSAKSGAADRFADDDNGESDFVPAPVAAPKPKASAPANRSQRTGGDVPPWKRGKAATPASNQSTTDDVVVVASKAQPTPREPLSQEAVLGGGGNFKKESTFQGERGGSAEDEELLALLRGVSAKSGAADRFADDENGESDFVPAPVAAPKPKASAPANRSQRTGGDVPPWKRGKAATPASNQSTTDDVVVVASKAQPTPREPLSQEAVLGGGGNFKKESTFQGERGGSAEDEELLALLRGVSAKSGAADRFADDDNGESDFVPAPVAAPKPKAPAPANRSQRTGGDVPPWKRGKAATPASNQSTTDDVVVVASKAQPTPREPLSQEAVLGGGGNFKKESTFQGERGGSAEDEELLALLRGVSAKSGATDRFADDENGGSNFVPPRSAAPPAPMPKVPASSVNKNQRNDGDIPPWKRGATSSGAKSNVSEVPEEAALGGGGGAFKQASTFSGERGGAAEDEELLALLRGISAKSSGVDRFMEGESQPLPASKQKSAMIPISTATPTNLEEFAPTPLPVEEGEDEIVVTSETVSEQIQDSNWKLRKTSYIFLANLIIEMKSNNPPGQIDGNKVMAGLDQKLAAFLMEKNANALEDALYLAYQYADNCKGATSEALARKLAANLIKGNGFTSPRPKAGKLAQALISKLMEVGDSTASINAITCELLEKGLTSKKLKVTQMSATIILDAISSFGAASMPIAAIKLALPKWLSHSNKAVRDTGMEVLAEFCRALGGTSALGDVIESLKKPQRDDLDAMLRKQPNASAVTIPLRSQQSAGVSAASPGDALAALQAGAAKLEAERFAKREAVDLPAALLRSDYSNNLKLSKWSKKVAGLNTIIECGGEKPYKLSQPSSTVNYAPLIGEMKNLLSHTHFAVVGKALEVLSMLAEGAGGKLFPNLRPLLFTLFALFKDKKLTKAVSSCLDSFFGNVLTLEHILDSDSAIPSATDERTEKNALARTLTLDYLARCISRGESAGPRGRMTTSGAQKSAKLASKRLNDSDANVRKSALEVLKVLMKVESPEESAAIAAVVADLESTNPRVFKQLKSANGPNKSTSSATRLASPTKPIKREESAVSSSEHSSTTAGTSTLGPQVTRRANTKANEPTMPHPIISEQSQTISNDPTDLTQATEHVESLGIPFWGAEEEEDSCGVLAGLKSSKWLLRQNAIKAIAAFVGTDEFASHPEKLSGHTSNILFLVKSYTKGFKESNVNVTKSILELFIVLCSCHERDNVLFPASYVADGAALSSEKIADKKLSMDSKSLLLSLCTVQSPQVILGHAYTTIGAAKSPVAHEEFLEWMKLFAEEFGVATVGGALIDTVQFLSNECNFKNPKVKKVATSVMGAFHVQLGPGFKAVVSRAVKDVALRDQLEKTFSQYPFDQSESNRDRPRKSIALSDSTSGRSSGGPSLQMEVPKMDLLCELNADCLTKMGATDGKTSWKARKAAMEDVESVLKRGAGLLDTSNMRQFVDLLRALRDRLFDSQSNLKPLAARLLGMILSCVDAQAQGKLGKVVYSALINCAMNDNRKIMHDACMDALRGATSYTELEGDGPNEHAMESFVVALVGELDQSDFKSGGMADVLDLTEGLTIAMPNLDAVASQGGSTLGGRFAKVLVEGLSSPKSEIRSSSEAVLSRCVERQIFSIGSVKAAAARQKPAIQRAIAPMIANLATQEKTDQNEQAMQSPAKLDEPVQKRGSQPHVERLKVPTPTRQPVERRGPDKTFSEADSTEASMETTESNPLGSDVGHAATQRSKAAARLITWPEYPEEPGGSLLLGGLKKAWAPLLPNDSVRQLFPDGGIRKQDDAMKGFELLSRAISAEKVAGDCVVRGHFGFICKWITYVLCSRESTVGLQALLQLISDLIDHLKGIKYELSDSDAVMFVPHLYDKASAAKGRFKDNFLDLMGQIKSEDLLPVKKLGPLVCVLVMESSPYPKARAMACRDCHECVETIGLTGIGKRGVLVAAKALSDEKLQENRSALLDLMVLLGSKMNGDMQRLARICGPSLSSKARSLIEERLTKAGADSRNTRTSISRASPQTDSIVRKPSGLAQTQKTPSKLPGIRPDKTRKMSTLSAETSEESTIKDELPALDLRHSLRSSPSMASGIPRPGLGGVTRLSVTSPATSSQGRIVSPRNVSSSSISSSDRSFDKGNGPEDDADEDKSPVRANLYTTSPAFSESKEEDEETLGAAASLRARLMRIRERNRNGNTQAVDVGVTHAEKNASFNRDEFSASNDPTEDQSPQPALHNESHQSTSFEEAGINLTENQFDEPPHLLVGYLDTIRQLLSKQLPLDEEDVDVIESTDVLKTLHAAVSQQPNLAVNLDATGVAKLRFEISKNVNEVVECLTSLIDFGFNCHTPDCSAGISVPLLSVDLASLMAIFRSEDVAKSVRVDALTVLIKEAGKALLDPRLASVPAGSDLDEATSTQMVRAINKLAVQAATGAKRHFSFEALIALQQQLCLMVTGDEDPLFRSRLSRVVTKLFARVVKAEEAALHPFSPSNVDTEAVICVLEDTLVACEQANQEQIPQDAIAATKNLAKALVSAILKAHGETSMFRSQMDELQIDSESSSLGKMVALCASELGLSNIHNSTTAPQTGDVAGLVSAVGGAAAGPERDAAVAALKQYKAVHGEEELNSHLEDVSAAFRAFILDQLSESTPNEVEESSVNSMSERIKHLRSKLNATEAVVQTAVENAENGNASSQEAFSSVVAPVPKSNNATAVSVRAFRERLVAAQEKRVAGHASEASETEQMAPTSAGSRAAALRARLQAVKKQAEQADY